MAENDPVELELFKNTITSITDEMALTIVRTAYSGVLKNNMDFSTGFADAAGVLVAQGLTVPAHLGAMPGAIRALMRHFQDDMAPGDVFITNDPFDGCMHLPDIYLFKPIFFNGERVAIAATVCHHTDVGGRVAGSNASDSTEIYQEGLRLPHVKLYQAGKPNEAVFKILEKNVRMPVLLFGDIRAQLAACHVAETQFLEMIEHYGVEAVRGHMRSVVDYAEKLTRAAIRTLPDRVVTFEDWIDDDGVDYDKPIRIFVTITKKGDGISVDWTGSAAQVRGAINVPFASTQAVTYCAIKSVLGGDIPNNEGVFRAIDVIAPAGSITNVVLPGACAARGLTVFRMLDCLFGALAKMLPDLVFAASDGGLAGITVGGYYPDRKPFIYVDFTSSAWGGRPWADGVDGISNLYGNAALQSTEVTEAEQPLQILSCDFLCDRGGPGKFRGGAPFRRDYRFLEAEAVLQVRSDRRAFQPYGLYGGSPGKPSSNVLNPSTEARVLPSKFTMTIRQDDVFRLELAGAGGWGNPLEREPQLVLEDVVDGFVSLEGAREDYGVVIDPLSRQVNGDATRELRRSIQAKN